MKDLVFVIEDKSSRRRPNGITIEVKQSAFSVKLFESQQNWVFLWVEVIEFWKEFSFDGCKYHWKDWELFDNDPGDSEVVPIYLESNLPQFYQCRKQFSLSTSLSHARCAYFYHCSYYTVPQCLVYFISTLDYVFKGRVSNSFFTPYWSTLYWTSIQTRTPHLDQVLCWVFKSNYE